VSVKGRGWDCVSMSVKGRGLGLCMSVKGRGGIV